MYLEVIRLWAREAFQDSPFDTLKDEATAPQEKVRLFISHTLLCLFGPEGKEPGLGLLLAHEASLHPSDVISEIVSEAVK